MQNKFQIKTIKAGGKKLDHFFLENKKNSMWEIVLM